MEDSWPHVHVGHADTPNTREQLIVMTTTDNEDNYSNNDDREVGDHTTDLHHCDLDDDVHPFQQEYTCLRMSVVPLPSFLSSSNIHTASGKKVLLAKYEDKDLTSGSILIDNRGQDKPSLMPGCNIGTTTNSGRSNRNSTPHPFAIPLVQWRMASMPVMSQSTGMLCGISRSVA